MPLYIQSCAGMKAGDSGVVVWRKAPVARGGWESLQINRMNAISLLVNRSKSCMSRRMQAQMEL